MEVKIVKTDYVTSYRITYNGDKFICERHSDFIPEDKSVWFILEPLHGWIYLSDRQYEYMEIKLRKYLIEKKLERIVKN